jgi:hypothetical protein
MAVLVGVGQGTVLHTPVSPVAQDLKNHIQAAKDILKASDQSNFPRLCCLFHSTSLCMHTSMSSSFSHIWT